MARPLYFLIIFLCFVGQAQATTIDMPVATIKALNKSSARTQTFDVTIGSTLQYGSLNIKVQACRTAEPLEKPENAAFIQVWEVPLDSKKSEWIFSGWMFSSSPALSAMDHPTYDIWVLSCKGKPDPQTTPDTAPEAESETTSDVTQGSSEEKTLQSISDDLLSDN